MAKANISHGETDLAALNMISTPCEMTDAQSMGVLPILPIVAEATLCNLITKVPEAKDQISDTEDVAGELKQLTKQLNCDSKGKPTNSKITAGGVIFTWWD